MRQAFSKVSTMEELKESSAIYEPMLAIGWIGSRPADAALVVRLGAPIPTEWQRRVVHRSLRSGIVVSAQQRGLTVYDFSGWAPGLATVPGTGSFRTVEAVSEAAKPALVQRLRVINAHLSLLHAVAMFRHNESPTVVRAHERDLYRFDYPDDDGAGSWFLPLGGALPTTVTRVERQRFGHLSVAAFEESADWLDLVIAADTLIEFDLLNQAQAAAATHDYALAVVAGWTVCELRLRALTPPRLKQQKSTISTLCRVLVQQGLVTSDLQSRLDVLRRHRNSWLHGGRAPNEEAAITSVALSTELLRAVVPDLTTRTPQGPLIL